MTSQRSSLARTALAAAAMALAVPVAAVGSAQADDHGDYFTRIATFPVFENNADPSAETVAEIVDYWANGQELVYTDGEGDQIAFVDISDPSDPQALPDDNVALDGEPTSVSVVENASRSLKSDYALVGVNTSESFVDPSGHLAVVDLGSKSVVAELELGGQPDSLKVSPSGDYLAIVIENERDEDLVVDGVEGGLEQPPPGLLQVVKLRGKPQNWNVRTVDLTGLAEYGTNDPEPEFVDVDDDDVAVVSLQENNHVAIVDLRTRRVVGDFDAGTVDLVGVDNVEDDLIIFRDDIDEIPREPDAIAWVDGYVATANEGDLFGGSRGFSIFEQDGTVLYDAGSAFDELARDIGHYPDTRSENKGSEPESIAYDSYAGTGLLFVGSERGSFVGVYLGAEDGDAELLQVLPAGLGPEGLLTIPERDLLVVSSEVDDPTFGVRATITIYERGATTPIYPEVVAADDGTLVADGVGWSAMSGMVATGDGDTALAVWDSFFAESKVFTLDLGVTPAEVVDHVTITEDGDPVGYDLEGITLDGAGGYWVVSEGGVSGGLSTSPNLLIRLNAAFEVVDQIELPEEVGLCRQAMIEQVPEDPGDPGEPDRDSEEYTKARNLRFGFEGVTVDADGDVVVAQQRGWEFDELDVTLSDASTFDCEDLSTSNGGGEGDVGVTRVWSYDPGAATWTSTDYELDPRPENASWVGLSEVTFVPDEGDGSFVFIERDNRTGVWATIKTLTRVDAAASADGTIAASEQDVYDLLGDMNATNGWISDKPEGTAIMPDGDTFVITDNDGVDDWSGETQLLRLGDVDGLFAG